MGDRCRLGCLLPFKLFTLKGVIILQDLSNSHDAQLEIRFRIRSTQHEAAPYFNSVATSCQFSCKEIEASFRYLCPEDAYTAVDVAFSYSVLHVMFVKDLQKRWDRQAQAFNNVFRQSDRVEKIANMIQRLVRLFSPTASTMNLISVPDANGQLCFWRYRKNTGIKVTKFLFFLLHRSKVI